MNNSNIRMQVLCALFAAFCAVCSQLTIPIQPVPITLGTFAVLLAGGFLGSRYGLMSIVIYLLLGAAGVPVFSMMRSGVSVIAGPAGGFIIGFAVMAFVTGLISEKYGYSLKQCWLPPYAVPWAVIFWESAGSYSLPVQAYGQRFCSVCFRFFREIWQRFCWLLSWSVSTEAV